MVKVQGIVEQNKNAYHRAKKMKPKDFRLETYIKTVFVQKKMKVEQYVRISK